MATDCLPQVTVAFSDNRKPVVAGFDQAPASTDGGAVLLKALHDGLALGRTSCSRFWANRFRVLLTAAAYVLLQDLRRQAQGTACATAQVSTLRERQLKLAVWVERSVRQLVLHRPQFVPWRDAWDRLGRAEALPEFWSYHHA
jgi:hypothetical protein